MVVVLRSWVAAVCAVALDGAQRHKAKQQIGKKHIAVNMS